MRRFYLWLLPLSFFAYQFILRLMPSLLINDIIQNLSIDISQFGILNSFYYYGYAGMQIPIAIFLLKYGAHRVLLICSAVCAIFNILFISTTSFYIAIISRFMIGAGSACGFLSVSHTISKHFSSEKYGKMIGFSFTLGLLGALYGGKPMNIMLDNYSKISVCTMLSIISILIGVLSFIFLRNDHKKSENEIFSFQNIKSVFSVKKIWILAVANLLMVGALEGFADVWGINYLSFAYKFSKVEAAEVISYLFMGMIVGGPLLAYLGKEIGNLFVIEICAAGIICIFSSLVLGISNAYWLMSCLFFIVGILCCYQVLVFTVGSTFINSNLIGVATAILNCVNMLGGSFFHTIIGFTIECANKFNNGTGIQIHLGNIDYSLFAYNCGIGMIPLCSFIAIILIFFLRKISK